MRQLLDYIKNCKRCGAECKILSEHIVEKLAVLPLMFYVIQYVNRHTACPCCDDQIYTAKAEASLVPNSQATPELLAHTAIAKCSDSLPLYRQSKQNQRFDCPLDRSKLDRWLINAGMGLKPFVEEIRSIFNGSRVGGIDETRLQVIKEEGKTAYQLSRLFVRFGGPPYQRVMLVDYKIKRPSMTSSSHLRGKVLSATCIQRSFLILKRESYGCLHARITVDVNLSKRWRRPQKTTVWNGVS